MIEQYPLRRSSSMCHTNTRLDIQDDFTAVHIHRKNNVASLSHLNVCSYYNFLCAKVKIATKDYLSLEHYHPPFGIRIGILASFLLTRESIPKLITHYRQWAFPASTLHTRIASPFSTGSSHLQSLAMSRGWRAQLWALPNSRLCSCHMYRVRRSH